MPGSEAWLARKEQVWGLSLLTAHILKRPSNVVKLGVVAVDRDALPVQTDDGLTNLKMCGGFTFEPSGS